MLSASFKRGGVITVVWMSSAKAEQAQKPKQSNEVPDDIVVGSLTGQSSHCLGADAAALRILSGRGANGSGDQD